MDTLALNRRDVLRQLAAGAVGAATSTLWVDSLGAVAREQSHTHAAAAAVVAQDWTPNVLSPAQNETVVMLTELIIPETETPGAKATRVNRIIDHILSEARPDVRESFLRGLAWLDRRSTALYTHAFSAAAPQQQIQLLTRLSDPGQQPPEESAGVEFFRAIKTMTISGYYATEVGLRQELGDDGVLFQTEFVGCTHPEHQG